jgi:hypothetical protein
MAEQQLRRSAEARLSSELRKCIKLTAYNQEIAMANTKLQQQLREARVEVLNLAYLWHSIKHNQLQPPNPLPLHVIYDDPNVS